MNFTRTFDAARKAQGFKSQQQLDAFFAKLDHDQNCAACRALDGDCELPSDGSRQPTAGECPVSKSLYLAYLAL